MNSSRKNPKMRPLHYIMWRFNTGGAELSVNHYIQAFGSEASLHAYGLRAAENRIYDPAAIQIHSGSGGIKSYLDFWGYCRRNRGDIFHLLNTGPVVLFIALLAGVRNPIYHIHGTIHFPNSRKKALLKPIWRLISWFRVTYLANSQYSGAVFRRQVLPVSPEIVYNGFPVDRYLAQKRKREGLMLMGYAGRLAQGKNVHLVIRLFEKAAADFPEMELHIAGDGPLRESLENQAAQSPFADRIRFRGFVHDMPAFFRELDLLVFPSDYESFGNVLAEALLTGLPILVSDLEVFSEIHGGEPLFVLGPISPQEGLEKRFLHQMKNYPELAQKAFELSDQIAGKFSLERHLATAKKLYEAH